MLPLADSPVINAGSGNTSAFDQRGETRVSGAALDIGAVETGSLPLYNLIPIRDPIVTLATDRLQLLGNREGLSLREAVVLCKPQTSITFDPQLAGTSILLQLGQINVTHPISIEASALTSPVTISGEDLSRIFFVAGDASLDINGVNFTSAKSTHEPGGAFLVYGNLELSNAQINLSSATFGGGIASFRGSTIFLKNSRIVENSASQYGGGLALDGLISIEDSQVNNNTATLDGGGIYCNHNFSISRSLISSNTALRDGGGIFLNDSNAKVISNTTIYGNHSQGGGGGIRNLGSLTLNQCTISGNNSEFSGGGIYDQVSAYSNNSGITLQSSIICENTAPDSSNYSGNSPSSPWSDSLIDIDPVLSELRDNGGPTHSMLPLEGSPAIDPITGTQTLPHDTDQRGYFRTIGATSDIGAIEAESSPNTQTIVTNPRDLDREFPPTGDMTLREAIKFAQTGATITFSPFLETNKILLDMGEITINREVTINGFTPSGNIEISGSGASRIFVISKNADCVLNHCLLSNGRSDEGGGAILAHAKLTLESCIIEKSNARDGGAIRHSSELFISNCHFKECSANFSSGGAIRTLSPGSLTATRSIFEKNSANDRLNGRGGAIHSSSQCIITDCYFKLNQTDDEGGGLYSSGNTTISNTTFSQNIAGRHGGLYLTSSGTHTVSNSTVTQNVGGGIGMINNGNSTITHCTITGNIGTTGSTSVGVYSIGTDLIITNSIICENLPPSRFLAPTPPNFFGNFSEESSGNLIDQTARLSPLAQNGGFAPTMVPMPDSPALDLGVSTLLTLDQHEEARIVGLAPDAGSTERGNGSQSEPSLILNPIVSSASYNPDIPFDSSDLTLGQALRVAQSGSTVTFSPALANADITIPYSTTLARSITVNGQHPSLNLKITSPDQSSYLTIDNEITASLNNIAFSNILVRSKGTLSLSRCEVSGIHAERENGAIVASGILNITECSLHDNTIVRNIIHDEGAGASIYLTTGSVATIKRSAFYDNLARKGGAIYAEADTSLYTTASTFSQNFALDEGGAIYTNGEISLKDTTISQNKSRTDSAGLYATTLSPEISNCIIAGNQAPTNPDFSENLVISKINNFLTSAPQLAPIGNYGGPTLTMAPLPYSPVIDAGSSSDELLDQRGENRIQGNSIDFGAVEHGQNLALEPQTIDNPVVRRSDDTIQFPIDPHNLSLREAATFASPGSTVTFSPNFETVEPETLTTDSLFFFWLPELRDLNAVSAPLEMGEITINTSLTIQGIVGDQKVTIDPLGRSRAFTITPQANVVFENLKFINGIEGKGGAILNLGILELLRCEVSNCHAPVFGAAIYNDISGHLKITNSLVSENVSPYDPSIIFSKGFLEATNSTFSENNGAPTIHAVNGETILNQVTIAKNMQGVVADSGSIKINFSTIAQNSDGGLSLINDSMLTLNSSVFFQNQDDLEASILSESLGDQRSIQGSNLGLSELGNYGGDTPTMPPLPTSLVINMAGPRLFTKDQRGLSREATGLDLSLIHI